LRLNARGAAGALANATDMAFEPELIKGVEAAEALVPKANDRERSHRPAVRAGLDGNWEWRSNCEAGTGGVRWRVATRKQRRGLEPRRLSR
jgi:hypothetical protein